MIAFSYPGMYCRYSFNLLCYALLQNSHSKTKQSSLSCKKTNSIFDHYLFPRHAIAVMHFNSNLHRETKKLKDGRNQISVKYVKFMNGQATIRDVRVKPNFGMQIWQISTMLYDSVNFFPK